jgi:hypothetical protein
MLSRAGLNQHQQQRSKHRESASSRQPDGQHHDSANSCPSKRVEGNRTQPFTGRVAQKSFVSFLRKLGRASTMSEKDKVQTQQQPAYQIRGRHVNQIRTLPGTSRQLFSKPVPAMPIVPKSRPRGRLDATQQAAVSPVQPLPHAPKTVEKFLAVTAGVGKLGIVCPGRTIVPVTRPQWRTLRNEGKTTSPQPPLPLGEGRVRGQGNTEVVFPSFPTRNST